MRPNRLYIVVPCYNEEEVLPETTHRLKEKMTALMAEGKIAENSRILSGVMTSTEHILSKKMERSAAL